MGTQADILEQLTALVIRLYGETEGFSDEHADGQLWYNRGYANGILKALTELGLSDSLEGQLQVDPDDLISGHETMAWGKAYLHGVDMGHRETFEIMPSGD